MEQASYTSSLSRKKRGKMQSSKKRAPKLTLSCSSWLRLPTPPSFSSLAAFSILSFSARWKAGGSDPPTSPPQTLLNCRKIWGKKLLIVNSQSHLSRTRNCVNRKDEKDKSGIIPKTYIIVTALA